MMVFSLTSFGQSDEKVDIKNFEQRKQIQEDFYKSNPTGKGTGYKVFKRWEDFVRSRLDKNGQIINNTAMVFEGYDKMKSKGAVTNSRSNGYWTELGADSWTNDNADPFPDTEQGGWNPGNGRINEVTIEPGNPNTIYAGAAGGGLWKSTDSGESWNVLTDALPNIAVSGIAISHTNTNHIYILTGDFDSKDIVSIGVLKSEDGGITWDKTGLEFGRDEVIYGSDLKMNDNNSAEMIATTSNGIYFTDDSWDSWSLVKAGDFSDVEYHPTNPDTVYACTDLRIYTSTNGGQSWTQKADLSGYTNLSSRIELAVTPIAPDNVYAIFGDKNEYFGIFFSNNRGENWVRRFDNNNPNILSSAIDGSGTSTQAWYDLCIEVSPFDADRIIIGGINIWSSEDGGFNWERKTYWREDKDDEQYVHADIHELFYYGSRLYAGTDGGLFRSLNYGESWQDLSEGLAIMQPHKIGITNSNTNLVYLGTQDNGVNRYTGNSTFENMRGADGFECIIDPTDTDIVYTSRQNGIIEKSTDGGATFSVICGSPAPVFNNPLLLRPHTFDRLIASEDRKIRIRDIDGNTEDTKSIPAIDAKYINNIDISLIDEDVLVASVLAEYIGDTDELWLTTTLFDENENDWENISGTLPLGEWTMSDVVIDPNNDQHIIVSFNGYDDGNKVFETWDRGDTWVNTSYNLENVPVNCIIADPEIENSLYIGTDLGVFYKIPGDEQWIYYSNGLPPVMVHELEINSNNNIIYAATYGRGLWKSSLYQDCVSNYNLTSSNDPSNPNYTGIQHYEANTSIESSRTVQGGLGTDVHYQAGDHIDLNPGFRVLKGNIFKSVIGECGEVIEAPTPIPMPETDSIPSEDK